MIEAARHHRAKDRWLLDRSAEQYRPACCLSQDGRGNLDRRRTDEIDGFVQSVGTAASLRGIAEALRRYNEQIGIVAVEPSESPVLSGGRPGGHKIDGIGAGFVVPLWQAALPIASSRFPRRRRSPWLIRLAREEGLFAGTSTGANLIAALRLAERLGPGATIVTIMCDTGMKYLKTYADAVPQP